MSTDKPTWDNHWRAAVQESIDALFELKAHLEDRDTIVQQTFYLAVTVEYGMAYLETNNLELD